MEAVIKLTEALCKPTLHNFLFTVGCVNQCAGITRLLNPSRTFLLTLFLSCEAFCMRRELVGSLETDDSRPRSSFVLVDRLMLSVFRYYVC